MVWVGIDKIMGVLAQIADCSHQFILVGVDVGSSAQSTELSFGLVGSGITRILPRWRISIVSARLDAFKAISAGYHSTSFEIPYGAFSEDEVPINCWSLAH